MLWERNDWQQKGNPSDKGGVRLILCNPWRAIDMRCRPAILGAVALSGLERRAELSGSFKELRAEFLIRRRLEAVDGAGDG